MDIVIVNYNAGNTQSLNFALNRLGIEAKISDDPETLLKADKVIFPGVGEASSAMRALKSRKLEQILPDLKQAFLGICLGMQLMCSHSEENDTPGLGLFSEKVLHFPGEEAGKQHLKIPHMGWNTLQGLKSPLFKGVAPEEYVYFVHSYYVENSAHSIATGNYILPFSAALHRDNFYAVQFHPEKSAQTGAKILENFLNL